MVTGPKIVIDATAGGKKAALSIEEYIDGEKGEDFRVEPIDDIGIEIDKIIVAPEMEEEILSQYMYSNVVTLTEFERILDESGPYGGMIIRPY